MTDVLLFCMVYVSSLHSFLDIMTNVSLFHCFVRYYIRGPRIIISLQLLPSTYRVILPAIAAAATAVAAAATFENMAHVALVTELLAVYIDLGTALFVMIDRL